MKTTRDDSMSTDLHLECWTMLPWMVTGRISVADKQLIERHLIDCEECRIELEQQQHLRDAIRCDEPLLLAPQTSFQKLMARIDASDEGPSAPPSTATSTAPTARSQAPSWFAIAASVQTLAIAALLALVWQQREDQMQAPRFTTLSSAVPLRSDGPMLRVVFHDATTNRELQALLDSIDAQVIAGPSEAGVYTLVLSNTVGSQPLNRMLATLRADPNIVFAEHVSAEAPR